MNRTIDNPVLDTDLDCNNNNLVDVAGLNPIPSDVVGSNDPSLTNKRIPPNGSVTNAKVATTAAIDQSKLNLNGNIPTAWLGTGSNQAAKGSLAEFVAHKGSANGYVGLDLNGRVDPSLLPSTGPNSGTVTMVDAAMPTEIAISGGPITGSGTFSGVWVNEPDKSWFGTNGPVGFAPIPSAPPGPQGVVVLPNTGYGGAIDVGMLSRDEIDGIKVGDFWYDIETADGTYDWTVMDAYVASIEPTGKFYGFEFGCAHGGQTASGGDIPDWLMALLLPTECIEFLDSHTAADVVTPVMWNTTYRAKKIAFYQAAGARYTGHPLLKYVAIGYQDYQTEDWTTPLSPTPDGITDPNDPSDPNSSQISRMMNAGYTDALSISCGIEMVSAVADAFPNQKIQITTNLLTHLEASPNYVTLQVISALQAAYGNRIYVSEFSNSNFMPFDPPPSTGKLWGLHVAKPWTSGQSLFKCFGDPTYRMNQGVPEDPNLVLMGSVDRLKSYGGQWDEIWYLDCLHLDVATIQYCHNALITTPPTGIRPTFLTNQLPVGLIPNLAASKITSGPINTSRLPVAVGMGTGHAKGIVPDPGDGSVGDKTDYLGRDMTWKQFSTIASYQPSVPDPNIFLLSQTPDGQFNVQVRLLLRGGTLFYRTGLSSPFSFVAPPGNRVTFTAPSGTHVQAYGAKSGYNNSNLRTYVIP